MNAEEFEKKLKEELMEIGVTLLDLYNRRGYLCLEWNLGPYNNFTSAFRISIESWHHPDDIIYQMVKAVIEAWIYPDNVKGKIISIGVLHGREET